MRPPRVPLSALRSVLGATTVVLLAAAGLPEQPAASPAGTEPVSVDASGRPHPAEGQVVSADGQHVAFASRAAIDSTGSDDISNVFVRDRRAPARTVLISRSVTEQGGNGDSLNPSISASGRYIAFDSVASDLQDGRDDQARRIVVCDRDPDGDGVFDEARPGGVDHHYLALGPTSSAVLATYPSLAGEATTIAWLEEPVPSLSRRSLAAITPGAGVVVTRLQRDETGKLLTPDPAGFGRPLDTVPDATGSPDPVQVTGDGSQVVFTATTGPTSIYSYELSTRRTTRLDLLPDGTFSGRARAPTVTSTGSRISFEHSSSGAETPVVVVVDRTSAAGPPSTSSIASRDTTGRPAAGRSPALSADGSAIAFVSAQDIVVRDLVVDTRRDLAGLPRLAAEIVTPGTDRSAPRPAAGGSVIAYRSDAVFVHTFRPGLSGGTSLGQVEYGTSVPRTVVLAHQGFGPLGIRELVSAGEEFVVSGVDTCTGAVLRATDSCAITITVSPTGTGPRTAVLHVALTDGRTVPLELVAESIETVSPPTTGPSPVPGGQLDITPDPLVFPGLSPALVWSASRRVTVHNATSAPVTISKVALLAGARLHAGDFAIRNTTCTGTLPAGSACAIAVTTRPQGAGPRSGVLDLQTTDPKYRRLVRLSSRAAQPVIRPNPAVVRRNRVITVTGQDFPPGQRVTLQLRSAGVRISTSAIADPTGGLVAQLVAFPQTGPGTWPIVATTGSLRAEAPVLVVPGTYQPPGFTARR